MELLKINNSMSGNITLCKINLLLGDTLSNIASCCLLPADYPTADVDEEDGDNVMCCGQIKLFLM